MSPRAFAATREDLANLQQSLEEEKHAGYRHVTARMPETSPEVQYAKGYEDGIAFAMKLVKALLETGG